MSRLLPPAARLRRARLQEWEQVRTLTPARVAEVANLLALDAGPVLGYRRWRRAVAAARVRTAGDTAPIAWGAGRLARRGVRVETDGDLDELHFPFQVLEDMERHWGRPVLVRFARVAHRVHAEVTYDRRHSARAEAALRQALQALPVDLTVVLRPDGTVVRLSVPAVERCPATEVAETGKLLLGEDVAWAPTATDPSAHVAPVGDVVHKLRLAGWMSNKPGTLADEHAAMRLLAPHPAFVQPYGYRASPAGELLTMERLDGQPLDAAWDSADEATRCRLLLQLVDASSWSVHTGVEHRDWTVENVLADASGVLRVFDLDQAVAVDRRDRVRNVRPRAYARRLVPWNHYDELVHRLPGGPELLGELRAALGGPGRALVPATWHALALCRASWRGRRTAVSGPGSAAVVALLTVHGGDAGAVAPSAEDSAALHRLGLADRLLRGVPEGALRLQLPGAGRRARLASPAWPERGLLARCPGCAGELEAGP